MLQMISHFNMHIPQHTSSKTEGKLNLRKVLTSNIRFKNTKNGQKH